MIPFWYTPQPLTPEALALHKRNEQGRKAAKRAALELSTFTLGTALCLPESEMMQMACRHLFAILDEEAANEGV